MFPLVNIQSLSALLAAIVTFAIGGSVLPTFLRLLVERSELGFDPGGEVPSCRKLIETGSNGRKVGFNFVLQRVQKFLVYGARIRSEIIALVADHRPALSTSAIQSNM